jgi:hypothetical protein
MINVFKKFANDKVIIDQPNLIIRTIILIIMILLTTAAYTIYLLILKTKVVQINQDTNGSITKPMNFISSAKCISWNNWNQKISIAYNTGILDIKQLIRYSLQLKNTSTHGSVYMMNMQQYITGINNNQMDCQISMFGQTGEGVTIQVLIDNHSQRNCNWFPSTLTFSTFAYSNPNLPVGILAFSHEDKSFTSRIESSSDWINNLTVANYVTFITPSCYEVLTQNFINDYNDNLIKSAFYNEYEINYSWSQILTQLFISLPIQFQIYKIIINLLMGTVVKVVNENEEINSNQLNQLLIPNESTKVQIYTLDTNITNDDVAGSIN